MKNRPFLFLCLAICALSPVTARADGADVTTSDPSLVQPQTAPAATASAPHATAQNGGPVYFDPSYVNVLKSMIRLKALDVSKDDVLDSYIQIEGCNLYDKFYKDDFQWNRVRGIYRQSFEVNQDAMPKAFSFVSRFQLDRYDFQQQVFRLTAESALRNVQWISLASRQPSTCQTAQRVFKDIPANVSVIIPPITVEGIKISPDMAENLIAYLKSVGENNRVIYGRFRILIDYAPPWVSDPSEKGYVVNYAFKGTLQSIQYFADKDLKHPIWTFVRDYTADEEKEREKTLLLGMKRENGAGAEYLPAAPATQSPSLRPTGAPELPTQLAQPPQSPP